MTEGDHLDTSHLPESVNWADTEDLALFECPECSNLITVPEGVMSRDRKGHCSNHADGGKHVTYQRVTEE